MTQFPRHMLPSSSSERALDIKGQYGNSRDRESQLYSKYQHLLVLNLQSREGVKSKSQRIETDLLEISVFRNKSELVSLQRFSPTYQNSVRESRLQNCWEVVGVRGQERQALSCECVVCNWTRIKPSPPCCTSRVMALCEFHLQVPFLKGRADLPSSNGEEVSPALGRL